MSDWKKCSYKFEWDYSPYYSICNTELYDKLPIDLKNIIEEVTVTSYMTTRYGSVYANICKSKITIPPTSNYKKPTDYTNMNNALGNIISKNLSNYPLLDYYGNYILPDTFYSFRRMINDCSFECLDKSYRIYVVPRDVQTNRNAFGLIQIYKADSHKSLSIGSYIYDLGRDILTAKYPDKNIDGSGTFAKPIICI